jgi:GAF domain-containing protein
MRLARLTALGLLTLALLAAPLAAEAQVSGRLPRVGYLGYGRSALTIGFEQTLKDLGSEDGRNIAVEWRWAQGDARYPTLAAELVRLNVDVILAPDEARVNAVRQATNTIPIVFNLVGDPVAVGYAASLRRPGGMITGVSSQWSELVGKRLEILKEALPNAKPVAGLANPPEAAGFMAGGAASLKNFKVASKSLGFPYQTYLASKPGDLDSALATMVQKGARSLTMVSGTGLFRDERKRIADLALKYRLPTMSEGRDWAEALRGASLQQIPGVSRGAHPTARSGHPCDGWLADESECAPVEGERAHRRPRHLADGRATVYRQTDRPRDDLRRPGGDRHRERAAVNELESRNRELTESLQQQTATSEILRVIASSPTDLQPVMEAVAENATRVCGATNSAIFRLEGEHLRVVALHGSLRRSLAIGDSIPLTRDTVGGRAVSDRRTIHVEDIWAAEAEFPVTVSRVKEAGATIRTGLATPLLREGTPLGVITTTRGPEVHPFSARQIALLETFANQAVIAIENVRLFKELEARTRDLTRSVGELQALGEVGRAISSTLDLKTVLSTIVARATQLSGTDAGVIYENDEQREVFLPRATEHLEAEVVETMLATPVRKGASPTATSASASSIDVQASARRRRSTSPPRQLCTARWA